MVDGAVRAVALTAVTVSVSPASAPSVSLASTSIALRAAVLGHRRRVVDGDRASLTSVTVTVTVAVSVPPLPSLIV